MLVELVLLNVAFLSLSARFTLGTGVFDKAVEWKGMFYFLWDVQESVTLTFRNGISFMDSLLCRGGRPSLIRTSSMLVEAGFEYEFRQTPQLLT